LTLIFSYAISPKECLKIKLKIEKIGENQNNKIHITKNKRSKKIEKYRYFLLEDSINIFLEKSFRDKISKGL